MRAQIDREKRDCEYSRAMRVERYCSRNRNKGKFEPRPGDALKLGVSVGGGSRGGAVVGLRSVSLAYRHAHIGLAHRCLHWLTAREMLRCGVRNTRAAVFLGRWIEREVDGARGLVFQFLRRGRTGAVQEVGGAGQTTFTDAVGKGCAGCRMHLRVKVQVGGLVLLHGHELFGLLLVVMRNAVVAVAGVGVVAQVRNRLACFRGAGGWGVGETGLFDAHERGALKVLLAGVVAVVAVGVVRLETTEVLLHLEGERVHARRGGWWIGAADVVPVVGELGEIIHGMTCRVARGHECPTRARRVAPVVRVG